jgi:hypothetical protein
MEQRSPLSPHRLSAHLFAGAVAFIVVAANFGLAYGFITAFGRQPAFGLMLLIILAEVGTAIFFFVRWGRMYENPDEALDAFDAGTDLELQRPDERPRRSHSHKPGSPRHSEPTRPKSDNERLFYDRQDQESALSGWDLLD